MFSSKRRTALRGALSLSAAVVCVTATSTGTATAAVGPGMADQYAERFGVSKAVAAERVKLQDDAGDIVSLLQERLGDSYAGVWFDHDTGTFNVPVAPGGDQRSARSALVERGVAHRSTLRTAKYSWAQLSKAQGKVDSVLGDLLRARQVTTGLSPQSNAVVVELSAALDPKQRAQVAESLRALDVPTVLSVASVDRLTVSPNVVDYCVWPACARPIRGGVEISSSLAVCTAGFVAIIPGQIGHRVLTAGHCLSGGNVDWSSRDPETGTYHALGGVSGWTYGANGDSGKVTIRSNSHWNSMGPSWWVAAWQVSATYAINGRIWPYDGLYSCRLGRTTQIICGTVEANGTNRTITYTDGTTLSGMTFTNGCSYGGDSGGPWVTNYQAVGIHSGSTACGVNQRAVFDPVLRAEAVQGVQVKTGL